MQITVDASTITGSLRPFWASTGFTPATLLLTDDMRQQISYCGSIPRSGLRFARVHYLLELVHPTFDGEALTGCDWSRLDQGLDLLVQNGLAPIFELMGNPDVTFSDFNDGLQLRRWRNLVYVLAQHLMERYGKEEVESWYFESWNEPDGGFGWSGQWPHDEGSFCNHYDACVDGLLAANPNLVIGGPGTCQTLSSLFRAFMAHCDTGINTFTGQPGTRLDFISIHEKGARPHKEDLTPRTADLLEREARILAYIRENHPRFSRTPFMNNECDPQVGWKDYHTWHARPYYAAWACRSAIDHLEKLVDGQGMDYPVLSNDNGFIGAWGHRTLLARFGPGEWVEDGQGGHAGRRGWAQTDFSTPNFAMVKKPIFNLLTLLSLLGERRLAYQIEGSLAQPADDARLGALATQSDDGAVAVLLFYTRDRVYTSGSQPVHLRLENLPFNQETVTLAHYCIAEGLGDPFLLWEDAGAPDYPNGELLAAMRDAQELAYYDRPREARLEGNSLELDFDLPLHGVSLVLLQPRPLDKAKAVTKVSGLRSEAYPGLFEPERLLRWDPLPGRGIQTYEVQRADSPEGPFTRVNRPDLLCSSWMASAGAGWYRVAARDFWGRVGESSNLIRIDY